MKTLQLSKNSQHYQFMSRMAVGIPTDICSYSRRLVTVVIMLLFIGVIVGTIAIWAISPWVSFVHSWVYGVPLMWFPNDPSAILSLLVQVVLALVAFVYFVLSKIHFKTEPGLIKLRYQAYRDKVCVTLEFKS